MSAVLKEPAKAPPKFPTFMDWEAKLDKPLTPEQRLIAIIAWGAATGAFMEYMMERL